MRLGKPLAKGFAEEEPLVQAELDKPILPAEPAPSEQPVKRPAEVAVVQ
ncbi:hypothetical protein [Streptomyces albipurpureus]|uniref:Uncharacterized protein n=1 Tax=Streptomyces albipurpureus TaxID=2897419 RepID=A0ABT0USE7_9ACTN|nr:hypothetical protein [Streptomyces sp. CWNU-1]MCM2390894.1 hypothetical protein [Streptomyces sp. CWNU-1]